MKKSKRHNVAAKIYAVTALFIVLAGAGILLREYLLLKKIQATLRQNVSEPPASALRTAPPENAADLTLVSAISRSADGSLVRARANFSAFRKKVEAEPELLKRWGSIGWKVLGDIPALCIRSVASHSPFAALGVLPGDCITHIDGESINQPLRNMGIWLTLPARSRLRVDTLRGERRIAYELLRK